MKGKPTPKRPKVTHKLTKTNDSTWMSKCGEFVSTDRHGQRLCRRCFGL